MYLVWTYVELYRQTSERRYLDYAKAIGERVLSFALENEVYWKSEHDTHCIDKRAGHGALKAFQDLYEATGDSIWLGAAIRAANWLATWQWHYNVQFPKEMPLSHFDYRTVGGTEISVEFNGLQYAFPPAAYEWCRLWRSTGELQYLRRARTLLHQGTQLLLTRPIIDWLNGHYMETQISDPDFENAHVEDVVTTTACYPTGSDFNLMTKKGDIQIKREPFYSMFGLVMPLDTIRILEEFGSVCYSARWKNGEALDALDLVSVVHTGDSISLVMRNRLPRAQTYSLKLFDFSPDKVYTYNGEEYTADELARGLILQLNAYQEIEVRVCAHERRLRNLRGL